MEFIIIILEILIIDIFIIYIMYLAEFSLNIAALLLASMKISVMSLMSVLTMLVLPQILAFMDEGVRSCTAYLRVALVPILPRMATASSSMVRPSVLALILMICTISSSLYGSVRMISNLSNKSLGIP